MKHNKDIKLNDSSQQAYCQYNVSGSASVDLFGNPIIKNELLKDRFGEVPFTLLDSRSGNWKKRKQKWLKLNIKSEVGRKDFNNATRANNYANMINNDSYKIDGYQRKNPEMGYASIFNPALAELLYNWFLQEGDEILDPFCGGSVRGIVANYMGFKYTGIDIRQEQIDSNREQAFDILPVNNQPQWYVGDSLSVLDDFKKQYDCVFTCPPYADLEVYSDLPGDISNMPFEQFISTYEAIIKKSIDRLKVGGWFIIVVGEVRGKDGYYLNFCGKTKDIIIDAGCKLYNEMIYVTPIGVKAMTANRLMKNKKIGKIHEFVYVFRKVQGLSCITANGQ